MNDRRGIWLEIENARLETENRGKEELTWNMSVRVTADKADPEPVWWPLELAWSKKDDNDAAAKTYQNIIKALDMQRPVIVKLGQGSNGLAAVEYRTQFKD